jgi:large subunit ribosomal protein L21
MYAVFVDGSRQYKASEGDIVKVDFRRGDCGAETLEGASPGTAVEFKRVLLYASGDDTRIGRPNVEGARVLGEVIEHPSEKVYVQHFRRRKNYRRLRGHRQYYTAVRIKNILLPGQEVPAAAAAAATAPPQQAPVSAPAPVPQPMPTPAS